MSAAAGGRAPQGSPAPVLHWAFDSELEAGPAPFEEIGGGGGAGGGGGGAVTVIHVRAGWAPRVGACPGTVGPTSRLLRVEVSTLAQPSPGGVRGGGSLHLCDIDEEAFLRLRADQGILVGFEALLGHLTGLLRRCQAGYSPGAGSRPGSPVGMEEGGSSPTAAPPLAATFEPAPEDATGRNVGEGTLAFFERGEFKLMCHLALPLRRGTSLEVEAHLAVALTEARGHCRMLSTRLSRSEVALEAARAEGRRAVAAAHASLEDAARALAQEQEARRAEQVQAAHDLQVKVASFRETVSRDEQAAEARRSSERGAACAELARLNTAMEAMRAERDAAAAKEAEILDKVQALGVECEQLQQRAEEAEQAAERERDGRREAERTAGDAEKRATRLAAKVDLLVSEAACRTDRLDAALERARDLEERVSAAGAAEQRERDARAVAEATASTTAARADAAEMRAATWRSKSRLRAAVCARQEALLGERDQAVARLAARAEAAEAKAEALAGTAEAGRRRAEEAGTQLDEARQQLEEDARAITWLNRRLDAFEAPLASRRSVTYGSAPRHPAPRPPFTSALPLPGDERKNACAPAKSKPPPAAAPQGCELATSESRAAAPVGSPMELGRSGVPAKLSAGAPGDVRVQAAAPACFAADPGSGSPEPKPI